jgi:hypothetical protein
MSKFNASFIVQGVTALDPPGDFQITGNVVDNTGVYYSGDVQIGDIFYSNGVPAFYPQVLRYHVISVDDNSNPPTVVITVRQEYPMDAIYDPQSFEGIIGRPNHSGLIQIPDFLLFNISSDFLTAVRNYQTDLMDTAIVTISGGTITDLVNNRIYGGTYTGAIDGFNQSYILPAFRSGSVTVSLNGLRILPGEDYFEETNTSILLMDPPQLDDVLVIDYNKA